MSTEQKAVQKALLERQLWASADVLRGNMSADEYQDYLLGLIFYKYLSETTESHIEYLLEADDLTYAEAWADEEYQEDLAEDLVEDLGFVITPEFLYSNLLAEIEQGSKGLWSIDYFKTALNRLTESTVGTDSQEDFAGLFSNMDLNSPKLGRTIPERSQLIAGVFKEIGKIDFHLKDSEADVLGDAYEYLISEFASGAGKKGGEFYTPQAVSTILSRIVNSGDKPITKIYDPTCGSGSLLLRAFREAQNINKEAADNLTLRGQELNNTTFNLARMNMILHGVKFERFSIKNGNTLTDDQFAGESFDAIVANPPYSAKWSPTDLTLNDERYSPYGKTAPSSKADYAFIQHVIHHLSDDGIAAVVLPHGVLFRGAAEGVIRKHILENNILDAVIGLPANIFFGTGIPTCILVFKKNREQGEPVLFIDASEGYVKDKNQNYLSPAHIDRIVEVFTSREAVDKFSELVTGDTIEENGFNLNIPRYVDITDAEELIELDNVRASMVESKKTVQTLETVLTEFAATLRKATN